jgi:uncharacterized protein YutE (UPF0331/DUF86 family)
VTPSRLDASVVADRLDWIDRMLAGIRGLPLESLEAFTTDAQASAAAESYLRRSLEALLDLGRHVLAKGFGEPAAEYKAIATGLERHQVLDPPTARLLRTLAGYRNRMVHFYHELSAEELHDICANQLGDLEDVRDVILEWIRANPERIDRAL